MLAVLGLPLAGLLPRPEPIFNPITSPVPLTPAEMLAGPFGLIAFLPLVPLVLLLAIRFRRLALILGGLAWLLLTVGPVASLVLLSAIATGTCWVIGLGALRRRGRLGSRTMTALVWVGLHALVLPLWWRAQQPWYPSRMAALHQIGLAYFLLRLVAWGTELAGKPQLPLRLRETVCWLLYAPCMRLGPVLRREDFLRRFDQWTPLRSSALLAAAGRLALVLLGGVGIAVVGRQIPTPSAQGVDFFACPQLYATGQLLRVFYLVPVQIYLLLWTYNQLAVGLSQLIGIQVDDNFRRLPLATSVREFWRRWHITVGAWLRDYIYIPLGGGRKRAILNITLVFVYCGLWHGASWSFLAWGLSQAAALTVQRAWDRLRCRLGWQGRSGGRARTAAGWLLTMHYQAASIVVFADFDHLGWRLFSELLGRAISIGG